MKEQAIQWHGAGYTRVPYEIYSDGATARQEQERVFRGATWNYLCLDAELPEAGSYRTTFAGETPVVVVKDAGMPPLPFTPFSNATPTRSPWRL